MTVKELRELLQKIPDDAEVWILDSSGYYESIDPAGEIDYQDGIVYFGT